MSAEATAAVARDAAMDAAYRFVLPKLSDMQKEKGAVGVWVDAFRAGWDAADRSTRPSEPVSAPAVGGDGVVISDAMVEAALNAWFGAEFWADGSLPGIAGQGRDEIREEMRQAILAALAVPPTPTGGDRDPELQKLTDDELEQALRLATDQFGDREQYGIKSPGLSSRMAALDGEAKRRGWIDGERPPTGGDREVEAVAGEADLNIGYLYGIADAVARTDPDRAGDIRHCCSRIVAALSAIRVALRSGQASTSGGEVGK